MPRGAKRLPTNRHFMWKLVMKSWFLIAAVALLVGALPSKFEPALLGADNPPRTKDQVQFFKEKVRPILTQSCYPCHADAAMGQLRVDSREGLLTGGRRGPAIVPGDPGKSLLIDALGLAIGSRADTGLVRHGAEAARVSRGRPRAS